MGVHPEGADAGTPWGTATGLPVPDEVVESLAEGKRPAVRVSVGAHTYRSTVASRGGVFMLR